MFCSQCGTQNTEQAKFCKSCGSPLTVVPAQQEEQVDQTQQETQFMPVQAGMNEAQATEVADKTQVVTPAAQAPIPPTVVNAGEATQVQEVPRPSRGQMAANRTKTNPLIAFAVGGLAALILLGVGFFVGSALLGFSPFSSTEDEVSEQAQSADDQTSSASQGASDAAPTISFDGSKPFWGAWVGEYQKKDEAEAKAKSLTEAGYTATVVEGTDWKDLNDGIYYVTVGSWASMEDANAMADILKNAGESSVSVSHTGVEVTKESKDKEEEKDDEKSNTVTLTVKAQSGEELSGTVRRDKDGYVVADSSSRAYSFEEVRKLGLNNAELCIAWNEPFARMGYHFKNAALQTYFESCSWYTDRGWSGSLSGAAATNNEVFRDVAGNSPWKELASN